MFIINSSRPTQCRANEYDGRGLFKRYVQLLQELTVSDRVKEMVNRVAETEPLVKYVKGHLRARPGE
jgi:hypothetical protein